MPIAAARQTLSGYRVHCVTQPSRTQQTHNNTDHIIGGSSGDSNGLDDGSSGDGDNSGAAEGVLNACLHVRARALSPQSVARPVGAAPRRVAHTTSNSNTQQQQQPHSRSHCSDNGINNGTPTDGVLPKNSDSSPSASEETVTVLPWRFPSSSVPAPVLPVRVRRLAMVLLRRVM